MAGPRLRNLPLKNRKAPWNGVSTRRKAAILGLAAFLVLDVIMVGWAVASHSASQSQKSAPAKTTEQKTPAPAASTSPSPSSSPAATTAAQPDAISPTRVLAALNGNLAWRSSAGVCPDSPPTPELTTDGGATWKPSNVNAPTATAAILTMHALGTELATMVALGGDNCEPQFVQTYVGGDNWAVYPDRIGGAWYVNPANRASVHTPRGDRVAPCPLVVDLASRDDSSAALLCSDHNVFRTADAGSTWSAATLVPGAVVLAASGDGYTIAATDQPPCAGVAINTVAAGASPVTTAGCATTPAPGAGDIALSEGGGTLWLWADDTLVRSDNGGSTWH